MRIHFVAGLVAVAVLAGSTAGAQTRSTGLSRVRLVQAYCPTGPCDPSFTFSGGSVLFKSATQPDTVAEPKIGGVQVNRLQPTGLDDVPETLDVKVSGTIYYGNDLGAPCALANTSASGPFAEATLTCTVQADGSGFCKGPLLLIDTTTPECSDVSQFITDVQVEVFEGGFVGTTERKLAVAGIAIQGQSPDCASGGADCP